MTRPNTGARIKAVRGRTVWDSRGRPTVEADVILEDSSLGRAIAPAGASTGSGEAVDLRDGGSRLGGLGVGRAVDQINGSIANCLIGLNAAEQEEVDQALITLDGTANRSNLGGNAMIAVSMAVAHAHAASQGKPLWANLIEDRSPILPVPEIQIFGGGAHADGQMDLQDFMVVPFGANSFRQALEWVAEIYLSAGKIMAGRGRLSGVADEGGYWPNFSGNEDAIETLIEAVTLAGFSTETEVGLSLDIAASQFFADGAYRLKRGNQTLSPDQWLKRVSGWLDRYPIVMIEDPFEENDFPRHAALTAAFGDRIQIVGDDLLVTQTSKIDRAAREKACNTLLCKPNQVGTLSEARRAFEAARAQGWNTVVSARSGESEDVTIAHLAVGWGVRQFKVGSFTRSERMAKWNEMLRIEESLGHEARFAGELVFGKR
jgi:enolase